MLSPAIITLPWRPDAAEHYFAPLSALPWAMLLHSGQADHPHNRFDILVADPVTTGDDQPPGEFVHAGVGDGVPVLAGGDPNRAGQVCLPAAGRQVEYDPPFPTSQGNAGLLLGVFLIGSEGESHTPPPLPIF